MTLVETLPADAPLAPDARREALDVSLRAGQIMLENGASTARVEETVARLGATLGAEWLEVFATPTGIFASAGARGDQRTRILRITSASVELNKVAAAIDISRAAAAGLIGRVQVGPARDLVARSRGSGGPRGSCAASSRSSTKLRGFKWLITYRTCPNRNNCCLNSLLTGLVVSLACLL